MIKGWTRHSGLVSLILASILVTQLISLGWAMGPAPGQDSYWQKLTDGITKIPRDFVKFQIDAILTALTYNPVLYCTPGARAAGACQVTAGMDILINKWIQILSPFYAIAFILTGLFFLLKAGTPRGRARARSMMLKLLFGTVLVAMSPIIYQALLDLSMMMVRFVWNGWAPTVNLGLFEWSINFTLFGNMDSKTHLITDRIGHTGLAFSCIFLYLAMWIMIAAQVMVWLRNMMVFFYGVFFPPILFFYLFDVTKPMGKKWLNAALKWIFIPPFQALMLAFTITISDSMLEIRWNTPSSLVIDLLSNSMAGLIILSGLLTFLLAPMIVGQLMSWMGDVVIAVGLGSGRTWMVAAGGIMAGQGSAGIIAAASDMSRSAAFERYMASTSPGGIAGPAGGGVMGATGEDGEDSGPASGGGGLGDVTGGAGFGGGTTGGVGLLGREGQGGSSSGGGSASGGGGSTGGGGGSTGGGGSGGGSGGGGGGGRFGPSSSAGSGTRTTFDSQSIYRGGSSESAASRLYRGSVTGGMGTAGEEEGEKTDTAQGGGTRTSHAETTMSTPGPQTLRSTNQVNRERNARRAQATGGFKPSTIDSPNTYSTQKEKGGGQGTGGGSDHGRSQGQNWGTGSYPHDKTGDLNRKMAQARRDAERAHDERMFDKLGADHTNLKKQEADEFTDKTKQGNDMLADKEEQNRSKSGEAEDKAGAKTEKKNSEKK